MDRAARGFVALVAFTLALRLSASAVWFGLLRFEDAPRLPLNPALYAGCFVLVFAPLLAGVCRLAAGGPHPPAWRSLVGAAGVTFGCAALLEIAVDTAWTAATGAPCWEYRLWPVHQGHTSRFGVLMWPMYGAFVQHFHGAIRRNPALHGLHGPAARAVLVAVEAMVLEILANALSLGGFGSFLFYYLPDDLGHLTTFRIFLPYVAAGAMGVALLGWLERQPRRAEIGVAAWVLTAFVVLSLP